MTTSVIGVGIIGANATRGWAATAHIPALRALPQFEIRALSSTRRESADAAGLAFGVGQTFSDHEKLIGSPDVDLVVVAVKVPHHLELVSAALDAGKQVYSEWPLGVDLAEARSLADRASAAKIATAVGLQARRAPAVLYLRDLIAEGFVGEVLSTSFVGTLGFGDRIPQANAYMLDQRNGANLLSIGVGHGVDALNFVLGEFDELSAVTAVRREAMTIDETEERVGKTAWDQIAAVGTLGSGAIASIHARDAIAGGTGLLWEINGTAGTLRITAAGMLPGLFPLTIQGSQGRAPLRELPVPPRYRIDTPELSDLAGSPAYNVGRVYAAFARDRRDGTRTVPDFETALARHEMLEAFNHTIRTARTGRLGWHTHPPRTWGTT
jgi:predicted dehydrogenase